MVIWATLNEIEKITITIILKNNTKFLLSASGNFLSQNLAVIKITRIIIAFVNISQIKTFIHFLGISNKFFNYC